MTNKRILIFSLFLMLVSLLKVDTLAQSKDYMELLERSQKFRAESKFDSALNLSQTIALEAKSLGHFEIEARANIEIAAVYVQTNRIGYALEAYNKAVGIANKIGDENLKNRSLLGKAIVLTRNEEFDSAIHIYNAIEPYFMEIKNYDLLGSIASNVAAVYQEKGLRLESVKKNKEAAEFYIKSKNNRYLANRYHNIGLDFYVYDTSNYRNSERVYLDSAELYFRKSLAINDTLDFPQAKSWSLEMLAKVYEERGQIKEALKLSYESISIKDQVFSRGFEDRIAELRTQYQTATAELEAEQATNRSLKIEKNRNIVLIVSVALIIIFSIWLYVLDQRRKNIKTLAAKNEELSKQRIDELLQEQEIASLQGVLEGQEKERKRVAIDLHDRLGGILSMVKLHFSAVEEKLPADNPEKKKFLTASELLDLAAGEVRNISHNMLSGVLAKFGLLPALKDLTDRINESGEIKLNLIHHNIEGALTGEQELQIYRMVQELISNILKHSSASEATIQLIRNDDEQTVNLIVEDDGKGFNPKESSNSDGIGLNNLKARVNKLKGTFHIDSGKGVGTSISIDIPIEND